MKNLILSLICIAALTSCRKEKVEGPQGPQGPSGNGSPGTITGKVTQYDQSSATYSTGLNTTTVELQGTSYSKVTDANGNYTLSNVQPGTYNVSFIKAGCGLWQKQQISFAGNGTFYVNGYVVEKPTYTFTSCTVKDSVSFPTPITQHRIFISLNISNAIYSKGVMVISGSNGNLDITNPLSYQYATLQGIPANTSSFQYMHSYGYSGTTYFKVYPFTNANYSALSYYSASLEKQIYTPYGTPVSTTFSVTIP